MASLQNVYRRGHVFWWRRLVILDDGVRLDIRVSLETTERRRACTRGALLTSRTEDVKFMLASDAKSADSRSSETDLLSMARAAFSYLVAQICDQQRGDPARQGLHSNFNLAYADYYQRMVETGGKPRLTEIEIAAYVRDGWDPGRKGRLDHIIAEHENGEPAIKSNALSALLNQAGYSPHRGNLTTLERYLYPVYRDACRAAEDHRLGRSPASVWDEPPPQPPRAVAVSVEVHELPI